jgi:tripartite-type tricarboxylate transporter receptor subunit TctC
MIFNVVVAPAATPRDVRARLHSEIAKATRLPELRTLILQQGVELVASASPEECSEFVRAQFDLHDRLWKRLGLKPQ